MTDKFKISLPNFLKPQTVKLNNSVAPAPAAHEAAKPDETKAAEAELNIDMTELEVKAAMNKALGFERSVQTPTTDYARIDAELAKDPAAFVRKYASPELMENAVASSVEFDAAGTLLTTLPPERQAQIIEGFSQRNESPRAFTGEFLDLFTSVA